MSDFWRRDLIVRRHGGVLDPRRATAHQRYLSEQLRYVLEFNVALLDGLDVGVDDGAYELLITDSAEPNALAYRRFERRAILVHIGLLESLWAVIARAAHEPRVLPASFPIEASAATFPPLDPTDWTIPSARTEYLVQVFLYMLEYVLMHEFAHHVRGHLDLEPHRVAALQDERAARAEEMEPAPSGKPAAFSAFDLEFDADVHAGELALTALNARFPFENGWPEADALEHVFLYVYAHLLVAQQLTPSTSTPGSAIPSTPSATWRYPAPIYRAINYSNLVTHTLRRATGRESDEAAFVDAHDKAWSEASYVAEMDGRERGLWHGEDLAPGLMPRFAEHETRLFAAVRRIDALGGVVDAVDREYGGRD